jgi:hypothetical protein
MRNTCKKCQQRPVAVNYRKEGKIYYRSTCDHCARGFLTDKPSWAKFGYKKRNSCDKCGFKSLHKEVFNVFHVDGNLLNANPANLKTICANCSVVLRKEGGKWRQGDLRPDF